MYSMMVVQVAQMMTEPHEVRHKEHNIITAITNKCAAQSMADMLHAEGYREGGRMWNSMVGQRTDLYSYPIDSDNEF